MDKFKANIVQSFREVKKDMLEMKNQILRLAENQENLRDLVLDVDRKDRAKKAKKKVTKKKKTKKKPVKKVAKKKTVKKRK